MYRGIVDFRNGYQPRTNTVKEEQGDYVRDCHSILARWRNHFSQLLEVHGVSDVRQTEIHTAVPLVPEPSASEVEMATEEIKRHKSPGTDQIPAELFKAGSRTIRSEIHKLINAIWKREECSNYTGTSLLSTTYKILSNILLSWLTPYGEEIIADQWISTHQINY